MAKVTTFRDADTDGDDKVTKDEFIGHMSKLSDFEKINQIMLSVGL